MKNVGQEPGLEDNDRQKNAENRQENAENRQEGKEEKQENSIYKSEYGKELSTLTKESKDNNLHKEETFKMGQLTYTGLQEIVQICGTEKTFDALKKAKKEGNNIYTVIKNIEPDKDKRLELYDKILEKTDENLSIYQKSVDEGTDKDNYNEEFNPESTINAIKQRIEICRSHDKSVFARLGLKLPEQNEIRGITGEQIDSIKKRIIENDNDVNKTIFEGYEKAERISKNIDNKIQDISKKVENKVFEITRKFESERDKRIESKKADLEAMSELNLGDEEMKKIMKEAINKANKEILDISNEYNRLITEQTGFLKNDLETARVNIRPY